MKIKKIRFMLVAHGFLKLRYDKESSSVLFGLTKSFHNNSILAVQHDAYWESLNSLVDLTK